MIEELKKGMEAASFLFVLLGISLVDFLQEKLGAIAAIIGSLSIIIAARKQITVAWNWLRSSSRSRERIEAALEKLSAAIFDPHGMMNQVARISASQAVMFQTVRFPAFECNKAGKNLRVNEAYLRLIQYYKAEDLDGTRWQQVTCGALADAYLKEFIRCANAQEDFIGTSDFQNPFTGEHRGRWRIHAPCTVIGDDCLFVGSFIGALDETAREIVRNENWHVKNH